MPKMPDLIKRILNALTGPPESLPDPAAAFQAELDARAEAARQDRLAYAHRLRPFVGRLVIVTDFGPDWASDNQVENASRVAAALHPGVFLPDTSLGISVHLTRGRSLEGQIRQKQSADLLTDALRVKGFGMILPPRTHNDTADFWLRTVTLAAEDTADVYGVAPDHMGHIAIVFALDAGMAGIEPQFTDGEAFLLTGTGDEPSFSWRSISEPYARDK